MYMNHLPPQPKQKIRSDMAGYYIYLPATFIYHWDARALPKRIEKECEGFRLDSLKNKIATKYTCGVAILYAPFWLIIHAVAVQQHRQPDGFSEFYQWMILIPGVFYMILGLYFLFRFLRFYFSKGLSMLTVLLIFAGTNLFYFGMVAALMAHSNSFFLFSLFLFLLKKFFSGEQRSVWLISGINLVFALIVLVRPTGIIIMSCYFFLDAGSMKHALERIRIFFRPLNLVLLVTISTLVFLPQFLYWKYLTGHFISYSYGGETFSNFNNPQLIPVWFAPLNGLFLYTPLAVTFIIGIILMIWRKQTNGIFIGALFLVSSYVFASWTCWYFGGSFGYRSLIEYYAILSIPFAVFLSWVAKITNLYVRSLLILFIIATVWYNQRFTFTPHWYSSSTWEWNDYLRQIDRAGLYACPTTTYRFVDDFENISFYRFYREMSCYHSPTAAGITDKKSEYYPMFQGQLSQIITNPVKRIYASLWVKTERVSKTGLIVYFAIDDWQHKIYLYRQLSFDDFVKKPGKWTKVSGVLEIPEWIEQGWTLNVTIRDHNKIVRTCFDDLELRFE
jgi:hypothetical protein